MSHRQSVAALALSTTWALLAACSSAQIPLGATDIGTALPNGFEASDVVWHRAREQYLVVSDEGRLVAMDRNGAIAGTWNLAGDLEAICIADPNTSLVQIGVEDPPAVIEYDLAAGQVRRVFDLSPFVPTPSGRGIEALTFVPDASDPEGGTFLVGSTHDGLVHRFRLSIASSAVANQVTSLGTFSIAPSNSLRALHCDPVAGVVYALYTSPDVVHVVQPDGTPVASHALPAIVGDQAEGLAMRGCELVVAQDGGNAAPHLWRFTAFDDYSACDTLSRDVAAVSAHFGGTQTLALDLGPGAAGSFYIVLGSASLGRPGIVGAPGLVLPLVFDDYLLTTLQVVGSPVFEDFAGVLDSNGHAEARLHVPANHPVVLSLVGQRLFHAAAVLDPVLGTFVHASNACAIEFAF